MKNVTMGRLGGFTLIELLVVVLIIGILAAIAVPQYQVAVMKSRVAQVLPFLAGVKTAQDAYYMANGKYSDRWDELDVTVPAGATVRDCPATRDLHPSQCLVFLPAFHAKSVLRWILFTVTITMA